MGILASNHRRDLEMLKVIQSTRALVAYRLVLVVVGVLGWV
jgi:hypothetical protein